jgi:hypothetical protein
MLSIFRPLIDRLKALFAVTAAQELEAEVLTRDAERNADLLRQAQRYQAEGLHGIADHLRKRAGEVTWQKPLAGVLTPVEHLLGHNASDSTQPLRRPDSDTPDVATKTLPAPTPRKKK